MFGTKDRVRDYFDEVAPKYFGWYGDPSPQGHSFRIRRQRVLEMIDTVFPVAKGAKVLDVGCGPGIMVAELVERGFEQVIGADLAEAMVEECRVQFADRPSARFECADVTQLQFSDNEFDLVVAMGLVEYLNTEELEAAYRELARITRPGGHIIITYPNWWSPHRRFNARLPLAIAKRKLFQLAGRQLPELVRHREFTEPDINADIEALDLKLEDCCYYNFRLVLYPFDDRLPGFTVRTSEALETLARGRARRLGTGFITRFRKT